MKEMGQGGSVAATAILNVILEWSSGREGGKERGRTRTERRTCAQNKTESMA